MLKPDQSHLWTKSTKHAYAHKTIINILNYNPELLGGKQVSDEQLEAMVQRMLADDKKEQQKLFDDFEDVSATQQTTPA